MKSLDSIIVKSFAQINLTLQNFMRIANLPYSQTWKFMFSATLFASPYELRIKGNLL